MHALGVALALAGNPPLIVIDDLDHDLELAQQSGIVDLLREIAAAGASVIYTCVDERTARFADKTVVLPASANRAGVIADAVA